MIDIGTLIASLDLKCVVEEKTGVNLIKAGAEWRGACPLHGGTNKSGFAIFRGKDGKQRWQCFTGDCGNGDVLDFIKKFFNVEFPEACRILGGADADPVAIRKLAEQRHAIAEEELHRAEQRMAQALADLRASRVWEVYNANLDRLSKRNLWLARGIPSEWQDIWQLGYNPAFALFHKNEAGLFVKYHESDTLTIPIFAPGGEAMTIRHRLFIPPDDGSKYHPERKGLAYHPFVCDTDQPLIGKKGVVIVLEGEIKSMVSYLTLDDPNIQVLGIAGIKGWAETAEKLKDASRVYIGFDPGVEADKYAKAFAEAVGKGKTRLLRVRMKIDDAILAGHLDQCRLRMLLNNAVHPDYF